ncbi:pre-tRNA nuclear export protein [Coemansia spiralis]|uniref:Exportin-T n=1 Tax=Coemansia spiralis TaxID=417178 RepID=A0A9W8L2P7_9FUNG|nr:pre-tRNA nuclear export protein [Coemansia spiralis]
MEQIVEAVRCAIDPGTNQSVKAEAMQYCESVKTSPNGWRACLELFTTTPEKTAESRLFALQVIDAMILGAGIRGSESGAVAKLGATRVALLEFVSTRYSGPSYQSEPPFIKNTLAHTITLLALASYPAQWPTFVKDVISLAGLPDITGALTEDSARRTNAASFNPFMVDFLLKVLGSLDEEMVNPAVPRGAEEVARNTDIKDAMRVEDVNRMAHAWYNILVHLSGSHPDLAKSTLRLMGVYVSWIDISLVVNQPFVSVIFSLLKAPALRGQACHCLAEIVGKGMRPVDKLFLIQFLDIVDVMSQLEVGDIEFAEEVGKLANVVGVELTAIWADKDPATSEAHAPAVAMLEKLMPLLLGFLSHEYDEVSASVFASIGEILSVFKKIQRDGVPLTASQQDFLSRLMPILVDKLKYGEDYPWPAAADASSTGDNDGSLDENDEEVLFSEMRRSLRAFIDAIAQIAPALYDNIMLTTAQDIFKQCNQYGVSAEQAGDDGHGRLGWVRAELGVFLTQAYGERLSSSRALRFNGPKHGQSNGSQVNRTSANGPSIESLADLLTMMIQSGVVACQHPAIAPLYFENCVRFSGYFDVRKEAVTPVLTSFLGATGVRHPYTSVRMRVWYFLHRFVKNLHISELSVYSSDFISAVNDLLLISADPSTINGALTAGTGYGMFDSQLFLFESCGIMLSPGNLDDTARMSLLQHLFNPLFSGAQRMMNSRSSEQILQDPRSLLQIHHYLTAIGSIVKGFPDVRVDSKTVSISSPHQLSPSTAQVFLKAADMCVAILEALRDSHLIREATRFALSRMLSVLGAEALPYLHRLVDNLVSSCAVEELSDLLGLLDLIIFKFKPQVAPIASKLLLPVISKVYGFLDQVAQGGASGTDEARLLQDLRKAYLSWVLAIFNSDLDWIFLVESNAPHLVTIFQPIAGQLATDAASPPCQKLAFSVLFKAIQAWMVDPMGWHTLATLTPSAAAAINNAANSKDRSRVFLRQAAAQELGIGSDSESAREARSQFKQFVLNTVVPACFETPTRPEFSMADAQASLVVSEIALVLQMTLLAGRPDLASGDGSSVAAIPLPQLLTPPIGGDLNQNQFAVYLSSALLPRMGCPASMATEFVQALASLDQKQFKKYFSAFLTNSSQ